VNDNQAKLGKVTANRKVAKIFHCFLSAKVPKIPKTIGIPAVLVNKARIADEHPTNSQDQWCPLSSQRSKAQKQHRVRVKNRGSERIQLLDQSIAGEKISTLQTHNANPAICRERTQSNIMANDMVVKTTESSLNVTHDLTPNNIAKARTKG